MKPPPQALRSLVFAVRPNPGEDIVGLLARAAAENGYPATNFVASLAGMSTAEIRAGLPRCRSEQIAATLGYPDQAAVIAESMSYRSDRKGWRQFQGTAIRNSLIAKSERRVAPMGLRQAPYVRAIWQVSVLNFDPETLELLLNHCPECRRLLKFSGRHGVTHCHYCDAPDEEGFVRGVVDLRDFPQPVIEPEDPAALAFVSDLISRDQAKSELARSKLKPPFENADRGALFDLVVRIAKAIETSKRQSDGNKRRYGNYRAPLDHVLLAQAARAVLSWPSSLDWLEETFSQESASDTHSVNATFGVLRRTMRIGSSDEPMCQVINEALAGHVRTKWGYAAKSVRRDLVTKQGAERAYHVSRRSLATWRARSALTMTRLGGVGGPILLDRGEVERLVKTRASHVSRNGAARLLGAPLGGLRSLAEFGLLIEIQGWNPRSGRYPSIMLESIAALESRLTKVSSSDASPEWIRISSAASTLSFMDDCLARAVVAACEGRLPIQIEVGRYGLFHRALIPSMAALEAAVLETPPAPRSRSTRPMTLREAGLALGSYGHTVALLRKAGFLGERITSGEIHSFKARYMLTREAVTRLKAAGWKCFGCQPPRDFAMEPIARLEDKRTYVWLRGPMETAIRDGPGVRLPIAPHTSNQSAGVEQ